MSMTLSDIYLCKIKQAGELVLAAKTAQSYEETLVRKEAALECQGDASAIAHCIASWGDLEVKQLDFAALWAEVNKIPWQHHNPWQLGLNLLREELATVKI
jgi:hypothetical protein